MSKFKKSIMRELGIRESSIKPSHMDAMNVDPKELEMGMEDETEHTNDPDLAKRIALHHLKKHSDYYSKLKKAGIDEAPVPSARDRMMSPTAIATPVLALAVRGSNTGGLPTGKNLSPSKFGGYQPVNPAKENSLVVNKTPSSGIITNPEPIAPDNAPTSSPTGPDGEEHPHQVQNTASEPPQAVTGAETEDDSSLQLKSAVPQGVDVEVSECNCEDEKNQKLSDEQDKMGLQEKKVVSIEHLKSVRQSLQEKAMTGKMNRKESEVYRCITEVLQKRGHGLEQRLFGKKSMVETAKVISEGKLSHEEVVDAWENDKNGEYIQIDPDSNSAAYVAHGRVMEKIPTQYGNIWSGISEWMNTKGYYPNIWSVNDHGNVTLWNRSGKSLGGLV